MAKKKKKVYAPTEQELALPQEYMTLKASPLKESGGILLDRTATILSNWTILGSIIGALLLLGPVVYSVVAMLTAFSIGVL